MKRCKAKKKRKSYLPLGHSRRTTKVPDEVFTVRDAVEVERDGCVWVLVDDDETDLALLYRCKHALGVGVRRRQVDLDARAAEERSVSARR